MSVSVSESNSGGVLSSVNLGLFWRRRQDRGHLQHLCRTVGVEGTQAAVTEALFLLRLLSGLGCGLVFAATLTITCQYFEKRRGLALGIVTTGSPPPPT